MVDERRKTPQCSDGTCQEAADRAVKKVFAMLGVNVDDPKSVAEFQEDLRFGSKMRRMADKGLMAFVVVAFSAIAAALWSGIVSKIGGH